MKKLLSALTIIGLTATVTAQTTQPGTGSGSETQIPGMSTTTDTVPGNPGNTKPDSSFYKSNPDATDSSIYNNGNGNNGNNSTPGTNNTGTGIDMNGSNTTPGTNSTTGSETDMNTDNSNTVSENTEDRVFMRNNKVFVVKNGKTTQLAKSMKLNDGSTVMVNGTVKLQDGSTMKLKNGEQIKNTATANSNGKSKKGMSSK